MPDDAAESSPDDLEPIEIDVSQDIPGSLRKLLSQPDRVSWSALWRALPAKERQAAAWFDLSDEKQPERYGLVAHVAKQRHFRKKTVAAWEDGKLAEAARTLIDIPHAMANN